MLVGEYQHAIDAKRRLPLPARLRDALGKRVVITRGLEQCLFVYSTETWTEFSEKLNKLPMSQASARSFARLMFSGAVEVELDSLGRVLIPEYLVTHAQLKKQAIVIGAGSRLEIWDKEWWDKYQSRETEDMEAIADQLKEFGI